MIYKYLYKTPDNFDNILLTSDGIYLTGLIFDYNNIYNKVSNDNKLIFKDSIDWLDRYFKGKNPKVNLKYKLESLTPFKRKVLDIVKDIQYGRTTTYKDIARQISSTMSGKAIGNAIKNNPICIIIPCHRVIGSNGSLTGYNGGIKNKENLLRLEGSL